MVAPGPVRQHRARGRNQRTPPRPGRPVSDAGHRVTIGARMRSSRSTSSRRRTNRHEAPAARGAARPLHVPRHRASPRTKSTSCARRPQFSIEVRAAGQRSGLIAFQRLVRRVGGRARDALRAAPGASRRSRRPSEMINRKWRSAPASAPRSTHLGEGQGADRGPLPRELDDRSMRIGAAHRVLNFRADPRHHSDALIDGC
jgi:hypothetical protein